MLETIPVNGLDKTNIPHSERKAFCGKTAINRSVWTLCLHLDVIPTTHLLLMVIMFFSMTTR